MIRILVLAVQLFRADPKLGPDGAFVHAAHAVAYETNTIPAELILGMTHIESDFNVMATSRPHGRAYPIYCSLMQTAANSEAECRAQRKIPEAYRVGVAELQKWQRDPRVGTKNVRRLLRAHGCGNWGISHPCNGYDGRVLGFVTKLRWGLRIPGVPLT